MIVPFVGRAQFVNLTFDYANLSHLRDEPVKGAVGPVGELLDGVFSCARLEVIGSLILET